MKLNDTQKIAVHTAVLSTLLPNPNSGKVSWVEIAVSPIPEDLLIRVKETAEKYISLIETQQTEGSVNDEHGH